MQGDVEISCRFYFFGVCTLCYVNKLKLFALKSSLFRKVIALPVNCNFVKISRFYTHTNKYSKRKLVFLLRLLAANDSFVRQ